MQSERSPLHAFADATILRSGDQVREHAKLQGMFTAHLIRPLAKYEDLYEPLWTRHAHIQSLADLDGRPLTLDELAERTALAIEMKPMERTLWQERFMNTVATVGKNLALDTFLAGSSYTAVGPYLGLISSVSWSATAAADTMASHSGWTEAGVTNAPTYTIPRKTTASGWSAAAAGVKALSSALSFAITGTGTVKGCFLVFGTGALTTIDNTAGTLMSAGVFSGGDKVVANLDTLNVSYSLAF